MFDSETSDLVIILISALAAAVSFAAFALPFLNKSEKKERYQSIIEKRRKDLFEQAKEQVNNPASSQISARDSMASLFKMQRLLGDMGDKVRSQLLQAGIRSPSAPIKFMIARIILPLFLMAFAMIILSSSDKEVSNGLTLIILGAAVLIGYKLPSLIVQNKIQKRTEEISLTFPDALDMMLICVQGGIGLEQTVARIAEEMADHSETLAEELRILSAEMAMLNDRRAALQDFAKRVGSAGARSFATALIQAEQYGTSVSQAMKVMSEELRDIRMQAAEQKAASLPPKLTVPMIAFFLPVLFIIIIGPAVLRALSRMN